MTLGDGLFGSAVAVGIVIVLMQIPACMQARRQAVNDCLKTRQTLSPTECNEAHRE